MISIKSLIKEVHDVQTIYPRDIYNLYYLEFVSSRHPEVVRTPFGREVQHHYLNSLKQKYVNLFKNLLYHQIVKYVTRARIDPDFDKTMVRPEATTAELRTMMAKTFRSDMQRRNTVWNAVADYTYGLDNAYTPAQIFVNINGLNNAIHNTGGKIMFDPHKVSNYRELQMAFNGADKIKSGMQWELMKGLVDKDIRDLLNQEPEQGPESFQEAHTDKPTISHADRMNPYFMDGVKQAMKDRMQNNKPDHDGYHVDFIRGYKTVQRTSWWDKFNDKLTQAVVRFGQSYGDRFLS